MVRLIHFSWLLLMLVGCSQAPDHSAPTRVETYSIDEATMIDFYKRTGRIDAHLEPRTPPAAALKTMAEDDERAVVIFMTPEKVGQSLGLRDRDRVALVDGEDVAELFGKTWKEIGEYNNASAFGTRKYTHFINRLFARRRGADAVELLVYRPKSDTPDKPFAIRVEFTD